MPGGADPVRLRPVATRPPVVARLTPVACANRVITLPDHGSPARPVERGGERTSIWLGGQCTVPGLSLATSTE